MANGEKFNVNGEQYFNIDGKILEIKRQIRQKGGSSLNPKLVELALQDIIEGRFNKKVESNPSILKLISGGEKITIESLDGQEFISGAKDIFKSYIDEDFKTWGINKPGSATTEIQVDVHEMVKDGTFKEIFTSISDDLEKLVMTQAQICLFCKKHLNWFRQDEYCTFFLTKQGEEYFVVYVSVLFGGLNVSVYRFENDDVWYVECRRLVVVPQLVSLDE